MKKIKYIFLAFLLTLIGCSKNKNKLGIDKVYSDSLEFYIAKINSDSFSKKQKVQMNYRALGIIASKKDSLQKKHLFDIANNFYNLYEYNGLQKTSNILLNIAEKDKDTINIAKSFVYFAEYYKGIGSSDSAYYYYLKAEKAYTNIKNYSNLADLFIRKADLQNLENDFFGSEKSALDALSLLRDSPNLIKIYEAYNLIGISSSELRSYQKAIEYFSKALEVAENLETDDKLYFKAISLNNIGNAYQNLNQYNEAIKYFKLAQQKDIEANYPDLYATLLDNIAYSKFKIGDYKQLPELFYQSLSIRTELKLTSKIILSKIHLSEYFAESKDTFNAIKISEDALSTARIEKFPGDVLPALKQLSRIDIEKSSIYSDEYIRINDSLQQTERNIREKFGRIQFETEEISNAKDKLEEQNRNLLYFFVGSLMIGMLLFVIRTQRAKNRELLLKQAQQKANEDIYNLMINQQSKLEEGRIAEKKRIAQELHDGVLGRLFGTRLNLDSLNRMDSEDAIIKRNNYLAELKNIEQDIREISHDLNREKYVLINNFVAILNNLLEEQKASFSADVVVNIDETIKWDEVNNTLKINLYRIIQESLQNINKYAQASEIRLDLKKSEGNIIVNVSDDGIGFTVNSKKKGIGLQNMLSRANELGGTLDIRSKKGKGTSVSIIFPLSQKVNEVSV